MQQHQMLAWGLALTWLAFIFAFGCIVGSFINVLVYRLPRGLNVIVPPSACPSCGKRLSWRENFPVLGWIMLRGRCRHCGDRISPEYPIVEFLVGFLFALTFALWLMEPSVLSLVGVEQAFWQPEWAQMSGRRAWPFLVMTFALFGSLITATLIDARTFTIPLSITWFMAAVGIIAHPVLAFIWSANNWRVPAHEWVIATPGIEVLGASIGGFLGIVTSVGLVQLGVMRRSFEDYEEWEKQAEAAEQQAPPPAPEHAEADLPLREVLRRVLYLTAPAIALMVVGLFVGSRFGMAYPGLGLGMIVGLLIGLLLRRLVVSESAGDQPQWVMYPHARREMAREVLYLLPCLALAGVGARVAPAFGGDPPLWLDALGGSLLGYLAGGGVVWGVRILGSLAFGKEAMGLGDVHLMAGVGAITGWIDPVLAFFVAPFLGISWAAGSVLFARLLPLRGTALPYGPHLAAATIAVVLAEPLFETALSSLMGRTINIP